MSNAVIIPLKELQRAIADLKKFKRRGFETVTGMFKPDGAGAYVYDCELCMSRGQFVVPKSEEANA